MKLSIGIASMLLAVSAHAGDVVRYRCPMAASSRSRARWKCRGDDPDLPERRIGLAEGSQRARRTAAYWGDTKTQALSALDNIKKALESEGVGFGDVVKMLVFLVGDPANDGKMDFKGFMEAYTQYFGTPEQPNLPARSAVQVAGLAAPGALIEIEVILAKKTPPPAAKKKH